MAKASKLLPMPVEELCRHPAALAMPAAAFGALARLCLHFWQTECRPLPKDQDQLQAIARAHKPTWRAHETEIRAVFEALRPSLEAYWHLRQSKRGLLDHLREGANGARRAQSARKREAQTALIAPAHTLQPMRRADKKHEAVGERQTRADGFVDPL